MGVTMAVQASKPARFDQLGGTVNIDLVVTNFYHRVLGDK